jgi:anthranilate/para-aminobenzoate synthase component II
VFTGLTSPLVAGRYHSLVVCEADLPSDLVVTARTTSGVVMGVRHRRFPVEGVQFHPESVLSGDGHALLANFLDGVARHHSERGLAVPVR